MQFAVLHHLETAGNDAVDSRVYTEVAEQVRAAGDLGVAVAWVAEHHFATTRGLVPAPLLFLTHLAGQTQDIRLGSAVLPAPFYHPVRLAESVALTDVLTGGRLACGISSSGVPDEMRVFGAAQDGKHDRLRESLRWLRRAWAGEAVEAPGEAGAVTIVPRPVQLIEDMVWVAASTEGAARVAGELGHHLLLPSLRPVPSSAAHVAAYREELAAHGHSAPRHIQNTFHLVLDDDHDAAMRTAEPIIRSYYERYVQSRAVGRLQDESLPAIMARINFVAGGPGAVAEQLAVAARALGLTHVAVQSRLIGLTHRQVLHGLELLMARVAPQVAGLNGAGARASSLSDGPIAAARHPPDARAGA
jgi:alkanesulfonate monooxygenase SsuD/methylene tetrahydromethanopterin reductase-like flavin-dependent oxidoreductase (luciferase family)